MNTLEFQTLCNPIAEEVGRLLVEILKTPEDFNASEGNCALCIMNAAGETCMRLYGDKPVKQRQTAFNAHKKALQVWLTGYATGTFETMVYTNQISEKQFGLARPELIGWLGGVEAKTLSGERLILAFSGVRGEQDVGILHQAAEKLKTFIVVEH
jgi:glc operon protein GlcG